MILIFKLIQITQMYNTVFMYLCLFYAALNAECLMASYPELIRIADKTPE